MILDAIVADKRLEIEKRRARISLAEFRTRAESLPPPRDFGAALKREGNLVALIGEIKAASPSRGEIRADVDPLRVARIYAANGAAAISVLTDRKYFHGEPGNLKAARVGSDLPLLRKDFIIDEYQVYESRALQADAILLIVRLLDNAQLREFGVLAESLGMRVLVEVHDEAEVERALVAAATIIGINNRNLADFSVDLGTTERLAPLIASDKIIVSESGIFTGVDVARAARAGAAAVLVGEALMRAQDMGAKVRELSQVSTLNSHVAGIQHDIRQNLRHHESG
jgi:indole-3-glycerol phosphate synthase